MNRDESKLVSVIIPTYNYSHFLPRAIKSVLEQSYQNFEIIVIDDGSVDDTRFISSQFKSIKYYYQENKGVSAARNAGIKKAKGSYLVFLDADDWLEPDALKSNYEVLKDHHQTAFISGNYYFIRAETNEHSCIKADVYDNHYEHLLRRNYIGMHGTVMFQRWVFDKFSYNENLKACEDYDLYLNVARKHSVMHHNKYIATYFFHSSSLSHNYKLMAESVQQVLKRQFFNIATREERIAYYHGLQQWRDYSEFINESVNHGF